MNTQNIDRSTGLLVLISAVVMLMLALQASNWLSERTGTGYIIKAEFDYVGGLKVSSPVNVGGVRVGQVTSIGYDTDSFEAVVSMLIESHYTFPKDTVASILTAGLLGGQYVGLEPGGDVEHLQAGDQIELTQPALVLEQAIGQLLYSRAQEE